MLNLQKSSTPVSSNNKLLSSDQVLVRINGTLPDIESLGNAEKSERAAEIKQYGINTNTSCSLFASANEERDRVYHLLIDVGHGIVQSIQKGISDLGFNNLTSSPSYSSSVIVPDALLITHSHEDHIAELPLLVDKAISGSKRLTVYCTSECRDQIVAKYPQISSMMKNNQMSFTIVYPGENVQIGPFSVTPLSAYHGDNSLPGSVIYIVKLANRKIIAGWDFLSLPNVDENLLWNPDLAVLGTQSYNPHPQTGMISISEAFELIRRWNAKECYIVHYRGLLDFEEASNQWFRGPTKAMTTDELQKVIGSNLKIISSEGKFRITVAREGMIWDSNTSASPIEEKMKEKFQESSDKNTSALTPEFIEIESLQNYIFRIESEPKVDKLKVMIEDAVNRYNLEFDRPRRVESTDDSESQVIVAQGVKGMMAKGPDLRIEIAPRSENEYAIKARASKGKKKNVFNDEIWISNTDAERLKKYIQENFRVHNSRPTVTAK
ncbi:MAG TPA: MBL fold metallo-hydrolase [Nitrososphaeraceae archaeon]